MSKGARPRVPSRGKGTTANDAVHVETGSPACHTGCEPGWVVLAN